MTTNTLWALAVIIMLAVSSCALETSSSVSTGKRTIDRRDRVVEQDLSLYKGASDKDRLREMIELLSAKKPGTTPLLPHASEGATPTTDTDQIDSTFFVEFKNEDAAVPKEAMKNILDAANSLDDDQVVFIVGHSHGPSRVGTGSLARRRADNVFKHFLSSGVNKSRVHRVASWGDRREDYAPGRGVQVLIMTNTDPAAFLIRLAKS